MVGYRPIASQFTPQLFGGTVFPDLLKYAANKRLLVVLDEEDKFTTVAVSGLRVDNSAFVNILNVLLPEKLIGIDIVPTP